MLVFTEQAAVLANGPINDFALNNATEALKLTPTGTDTEVTGITGGQTGRVLLIMNNSTTLNLNFADQDPQSQAANRFAVPGSSQLTPVTCGWFYYTGSRWVAHKGV